MVSKEVLEFGRRSLSHMKPSLNICSECETWFVQRTWKSHKQWHVREPHALGTALQRITFQLHPTSQESCVVDMSCWQSSAGCSQGQKCCSCLSFPSNPSSFWAAEVKQCGAVLVGRWCGYVVTEVSVFVFCSNCSELPAGKHGTEFCISPCDTGVLSRTNLQNQRCRI